MPVENFEIPKQCDPRKAWSVGDLRPAVEAVAANDPASRVNTVPKLIDPECHHQWLGIAMVHIGENPPQRFGRIDASVCDAATKAFCKVAQKIKALLDVSTSVNFREVDCFLAVQGCG